MDINSYTSWIQLTTDFDLDGEGDINADPEGDSIKNLLEYGFGGSATETDTFITPTTEIMDVIVDAAGTVTESRFVMTWKQINESASGSFGPVLDENGFEVFPGGYKVRDITYIPEFSTDGINWDSGQDGFQVAYLVDGEDRLLNPDGTSVDLPESE